MHSLMLGWEFPPHITGGLGTACAGLLRGFAGARPDVRVTFVLPTLTGDEWRGPWSLRDAARARADRVAASAPALAPASAPALAPASAPALAPALAPASAAPAGAYTALADQVAQFAHDAAALADAGGADFDVIHAHDWMTFPAALALRAATGTPFVAHVHSTAFDRNETPDPHVLAIETAGLTGAHRVIAVSHYTKALLVQRFALDPAAIAVVHNGWSHVRQAAPIGTAPRAPLVTFLGRVTYQKGPHAFLHAARRILEAVPHARFVLAGDGDLLASCRRLAAALGIGHRVAFPGFLGRAASADLLAASAAFVMPSLSEPFGIVALEAAAQGAPLVLSARAGVNEVVSAALRVDPADDAAIAAAVCRLLCDRPLAARLADRARIEATAMRWDDAARRIAALYETTVRRERVFPP